MTHGVEVIDIGEHNLPQAKTFLERYPETSLFLLSNIRAFGTRLGDSLYSGNFKGIWHEGELRAVFCLTRGGSLIAQSAGCTEWAPEIVGACAREPFAVRSVVGEWNVCKSIWELLVESGRVRSTLESKEISYRLDLSRPLPSDLSTADVRVLTVGDDGQWDELAVAFQRESRMPAPGTRDQRKAAFVRSTALQHWWGAFREDRMVSLAAIIAMHETLAQVGSVFTLPAHRRQGLSRAVMTKLIRDSRLVHRLNTLFLFTGEDNGPARQLYESLGFERFGHFGLFFGEPS